MDTQQPLDVSHSAYNSQATRLGNATTTYGLFPGSAATGPVHLVMETLLDQPTHWPVDRRMDGMDGGLDALLTASSLGKSAARAYALRHGENTGDLEVHEHRRARALRRLRGKYSGLGNGVT